VFLDPQDPFECAGLVADNYFIFPNGRVYRCPLCEDYPLHSLEIRDDRLVETAQVNEANLFPLLIPEGCVMNRIIQPRNLSPAVGGKLPYKLPVVCSKKRSPLDCKSRRTPDRRCQGIAVETPTVHPLAP
jgi:hypothetical protein